MNIYDKSLLIEKSSRSQDSLNVDTVGSNNDLRMESEVKDESDEASQALFAMNLNQNDKTVVLERKSGLLNPHLKYSGSRPSSVHSEVLPESTRRSLDGGGQQLSRDIVIAPVVNRPFVDSHVMNSSLKKTDLFMSALNRESILNRSKLGISVNNGTSQIQNVTEKVNKLNGDSLTKLATTFSTSISKSFSFSKVLLPTPQSLLADISAAKHERGLKNSEKNSESSLSSVGMVQSQWAPALDNVLSQLANASKTRESAAAWLHHQGNTARLVTSGKETSLLIKIDHHSTDGVQLQLTLSNEGIKVDMLQQVELLSKDSLSGLQSMLEEKYPLWKFILAQRLDAALENKFESRHEGRHDDKPDSSNDHRDKERQRDSNDEEKQRMHQDLFDELS